MAENAGKRRSVYMRRAEGREKRGSRWVIRIELIVLLAFVCTAISRELKGGTKDSAQEMTNE